ncbi:MAG: methionyl-tRNA formyltransferase [Candidatus Marinimicrobia bacterium]|nr:methionyl-tRNA formyltransferase [Candidatus Neomarinimicrobiota bacterium]|tara:strand:+ start:21863 stop:22795 length:933 start_codon:yes stop_codon:yes gene_type:complete
MKILFFGNADFGIPSLEYLYQSNYEFLSVVTNRDKKSGRGKKYSSTPIKEYSLKNKIPTIEVEDLNNHNFENTIKELNPDLIIVIAYRILPEKIFSIPTFGTMNLHASLLPKYRGAAPIQRAILNNEIETGISTFLIDSNVDTGNIIKQKKIEISESDNYGDIYSKLSKKGPQLIEESINHIINKKPLIKQNDDFTYAKKIKKNENQINWNLNSKDIINTVRAFAPYPGAFSYINNKRIKILISRKIQCDFSINAGYIYINSKSLIVGTGNGAIEVLELQQEGKKKIGASDFINGLPLSGNNELKFEFKK